MRAGQRPQRVQRQRDGHMDVRSDLSTDGSKYRHMEIQHCVLQDIGPLGMSPLRGQVQTRRFSALTILNVSQGHSSVGIVGATQLK